MIKTPLSTMIGGAFWTPNCTIIGGTSKTFDQLIKSLFANGEQGFAYDPNDLTTMYQDAAGTVPVTEAGQPVGLMLDKSKGLELGAELAGATGQWWNDSSWTKAGNVYTHAANAADGGLFISRQLLPNKWLLLKVKINLRAGVIGIYRNSALHKNVNTVGITTHEIIMRGVAGATNPRILDLYAQPLFDGDVDISLTSLREIQGNHTYQTKSSMRPLLVANPQRLDFDIADDNLITNFPAQLTGCTVIRAVPNVGTQILTNQTIPTTYIDNIDHCGLIVINRALTATETSQITNIFNKVAGV